MAAMHILPHYTTVDAAKYEDRELRGGHAFDAFSGDLLSSTREIVRAVATQNYALLTQLTEHEETRRQLFSFAAYQSADVKRTPLEIALANDDVQAVTVIRKALTLSHGSHPSVSLPSHSTGSHTSAFSDYNRRAINASRGGREGNNALLEDYHHTSAYDQASLLWELPASSVKMMTVLYPKGEWVNDGSNPNYVASAVRAGNLALAAKMVEVLAKNGGWGYNDLHVAVLSASDQELPTFRSVSVLKKAQQTKITPLHFAAINPNVKYLKALWENGGADESDLRDDAQFEPIHYAAANPSPVAAKFLLERKANLLSRTKEKHTPLMRAIMLGREDTAIAMLEHVATESEETVNQVLTGRGPESYQLIHFAAKHNCVAVLKHLLKVGVNVNALATGQTTALSLAARHGHFECVEVLVAHGAKVDKADKLKRTPLLLAVKNGHTRIAAFLINNGANVNAYDSSENSVVHYAASYGWMSALQLLYDAGADFWSRNSWGFVPLICAMLKQRMVCVDFILQSDSEQRFLDFRDRSGRTMLFLQCQHSTNLAQIQYLLDKGLDPNIPDSDNECPLDLLLKRAAIKDSDKEFFQKAIRALLEHGADVNYTNPSNQRPLDVLIQQVDGGPDKAFYLDMIRAFLERGADVNYSSGYYHERPINGAIQRAKSTSDKLTCLTVVKELVKSGANVNYSYVNKEGEAVYPSQPLQSAIRSNAQSIFDFLLGDAGADAFVVEANGCDAWLASAQLGVKGAYYLQKLMDKFPTPRAFTNGNIFHSIVSHVSSEMIPAALVDRLLQYCTNADELLHDKGASNRSPLMVMYESNKVPAAKVLSLEQTARLKRVHQTFCQIARLFGRRITDIEALKKYVTIPKPKDKDAPAEDSEMEEMMTVFDSTILHVGARQKTTGQDAQSTWFGENLVGLLFDACPLSKSLLEVPDRGNQSTPLVVAVTNGDTGMVRLLLRAGADVNYVSRRCTKCRDELASCGPCLIRGMENTPLVLATKSVRLELMQVLLEGGASVDCYGSATTLDTPLHLAMKSGNVAQTKLLLQHGASMVKRDAAKSTPLAAAIAAGYSVEMRKPHEGEVKFSTTTLGRGCKPPGVGFNLTTSRASGTSPAANSTSTFGFSFSSSSSASTTFSSTSVQSTTGGFGSSMPAATSSSSFGGFNFQTSTGPFGPSTTAATSNPFATSFQSFGSSMTTPIASPFAGFSFQRSTPSPATASTPSSLAGSTVVDVALACGNVLEAIVASDESGRTPLHHAATKRDLPLLQAVLNRVPAKEKAAYVNKCDAFGRTALHFALNSVSMKPDASFDVERFLFLSGADAGMIDNFGLSALHFALRKIDMDWHLKYDSTLLPKILDEQKATGEYEVKKEEAYARHLHGTSLSPADPVETLSNLIAAGCDPVVCDALGRSPMHLAASIGAFVCASTLLSACPVAKRPLMLEQQDVEGFTPLGRAFQHARETTITTLIQSGATVSGSVVINGRERSYFSVAVEKSMSGICHMLLNAGFSRRQAVEDAVCGNQLHLARNLMVGLEVSNDRGLLVAGNSRGETLLHCLAKHSNSFDELAIELVWTLVDDGLDVLARDDEGNTALHYAAARANKRLMDFLFHHKADVNAKNLVGQTPFMYAVASQSIDQRLVTMQYMLLRQDFNVRLEDPAGVDALGSFITFFWKSFESDEALLPWFEMLMRRHGDLNRLFSEPAPTIPRVDLFQNRKLGDSTVATAPLLVWAGYAPSSSTRLKLLRSFIRHGASPSTTDSNGNTVLSHFVARNMVVEAEVVLDEAKATPGAVEALLGCSNDCGQTALHLAVEPLEYASYENVKMVELLVKQGASFEARDADGCSVLDYTTRQASRYVFRFLKSIFPSLVHVSEEAAFDDAMQTDDWNDVPGFEIDAELYLNECEASGKIAKVRNAPEVDSNCDVGDENSVYGELNADGEVIEGEEFNALLTKVDVKHGKFGINVFYRTQVVHDEIQNIFIVFTNWGRIGEEGKFQNTPFHNTSEAVAEFKKIFKSKTGNAWEDRHEFEKRPGKYNLVQRVDFSTKIDRSVTQSFTEYVDQLERDKLDVTTAFAAVSRDELRHCSVLDTLFAITDVRHLQLAASQNCNYYNDLPMARDHELRHAMEMLTEIRGVLTEQAEIKREMEVVSGDLASDDATTKLADLSDKFASITEDLSERSSRYYEVVPRNEDRRGSAIAAFDDFDQVDKELYRLKKLLEITRTYKMLLGAKMHQSAIHPMEYMVDALQIHVSRLDTDDQERALLTKYFTSGIRPSEQTRYRVSNVFAVTRRGEFERFEDCVRSDSVFSKQHTRLLWHGTRRTNLMGILSEGLRIAPREAPHNGYMYGKGIYFSDVAAKSLNYCDSPYSIEVQVAEKDGETVKTKTTRREVQYMLLCEVALGNQRDTVSSSMYERQSLAQDGFHSIRAVGQHMPNESESLVSPSCGAKIPLGRVGRPGYDFERASAWAVKETNTNSNGYSFQSWGLDAEAFLNQLIGDSTTWAVTRGSPSRTAKTRGCSSVRAGTAASATTRKSRFVSRASADQLSTRGMWM